LKFIILLDFVGNKLKLSQKNIMQIWTISPYYSTFTAQRPKEFLKASFLLLCYFTHVILG